MNRFVAAAALAAALFATQASADDYPNRPIRVFTTSSAGGISDIFMRVLNEALRDRLGQPLIIENKPGGAGNIAARACQDATPDGYTICIINADTMISSYSTRYRKAKASKGLTGSFGDRSWPRKAII